jgi:mannose-1-phosphate guanylyltransferase
LQTLTLPKPLVEFANRPMIVHQIEALAEAGVTDVVLAVNYRPEVMEKHLAEVSSRSCNRAAAGREIAG